MDALVGSSSSHGSAAPESDEGGINFYGAVVGAIILLGIGIGIVYAIHRFCGPALREIARVFGQIRDTIQGMFRDDDENNRQAHAHDPPLGVPVPVNDDERFANLEADFFPDEHRDGDAIAGDGLADFNLGDNGVRNARLFQEDARDDAGLDAMVRQETTNDFALDAAPAAVEDDPEVHPLIATQQDLAAVSRGEAQAPVELSPAYVRYATKSFERERWRSADGAAASFQAHDLYAGVLYPYALSVTAYAADSPAVQSCGDSLDRWAAAVRGSDGPRLLGLCVVGADTGAAALSKEAGVGDNAGREAVLVVAVTPFEPEALSVASLLESTSARMGPLQWRAVARRVIDAFTSAHNDGVHAVLDPRAVFVDPQQQRASLKDRRVGNMSKLAASTELLSFLRELEGEGPSVVSVPSVDTATLTDTSIAEIVRCYASFAPATLAFLDDGEFPIKVTSECSVCYVDVESVGPHLQGAECCSPARHFVCAECVNLRVAAALKDAVTEFTSLPCAMSPACPSVWTFDDFGAMVTPQNICAWQKLCVDKARRAARLKAAADLEAVQRQLANGAQRSAAQVELRQHAAAVRRHLRPACPHCGMPFESFTGCLAVKCGAQDDRGRQVHGCGHEFCGACMVPAPCPKRCGHRFVSQGELFTLWKEWRRARVQRYFTDRLSGPEQQHMRRLALRACQADLDQAGVYPLFDDEP